MLDRFERYVAIDTQSRRDRDRSPSTAGQLELARLLVKELNRAGLHDVLLDQHGYVTATLPGSTGRPVFGLIAHLDTTPDTPGAGVRPLVHRSYDGGVIELPLAGTRLDPAEMPELARKRGHDIVTASGDTLLGADDMAGIAEIMAAVAHLAAHPELPRATLRVAFTPDEEIGEGASLFDIAGFGAPRAYTLDAGDRGELEDETFSAVEVLLRITGVDVHPGLATGRMVSALKLAARIVAALPSDRLTPDTAAGREGFIHPYELSGTTARAELRTIVRDFDDEQLAAHVRLLEGLAATVVDAEPRAQLEVDIRRQYPNMRSYIARDPEVVAAAVEAYRAEGIEPDRHAARGGTDGSRLSEMGLPTPNLFTGGHEWHSVREWASLDDMAAAAAVLVRLAGVWARRAAGDGETVAAQPTEPGDRPGGRRGAGGRSGALPGTLAGVASTETATRTQLASLDGEITDAAEARIPATDEGLLRGDGVFEVVALYDGRPFGLEAHLQRLQRSADNIRLRIDLDAVKTDADALLEAARAGELPAFHALRIVLTRGGHRLLLTEQAPRHDGGVRLATVTYSPTVVLDGIKSLSYAANMLSSRIARERGFDEALLVTPNGIVLEAPTSSIFWVKDGELLTPPISDHILASITRAAVIECSGTRERTATLADVKAADEAFLAGTLREVQGISAIDERTFDPTPGPVTARVARELSDHIAAALASA